MSEEEKKEKKGQGDGSKSKSVPGELGMMKTSQVDVKVRRRDDDSKEEIAIDKQALQRARSQEKAVFNNEIEILPKKALPQYDKGEVKAYAAQPVGQETCEYFAMVCENHLPPRTLAMDIYAASLNPTLVRLVAAGIVYWPPAKEQRYVIIYENTLGKPLIASTEKHKPLNWKHDKIQTRIVRPLVNLLLDLRDANLFHGQIRPSNLFDGGNKEFDKVKVGECLSMPPGYSQNVVFEPIERAMTDPVGRGIGTVQDDLYSLGVTVFFLIRSKNPVEGMTDDEIIRHKIEYGSYSMLSGKERYSSPLLELLRGILNDTPGARWTLDDVNNWFEGQRLSPKQSGRKVKANLPLEYKDEKYFRPGILAIDMEEDVYESARLIESDSIANWCERSLEDSSTTARVTDAKSSASEGAAGPNFNDQLVARVRMALDPMAPIRYRGIHVHPEGLPYALAHAIAKDEDVSPFVDIIRQKLVNYWLALQYNPLLDVGTLASRFENAQAIMLQQNIGYGIERCLYYLCKEAPCYSDKTKGYYIRTPDDLMFAFEEISERKDRPELFIDRHVAAFLSVKDKKVIDSYLIEINAEEYYYRILGNIKTLALIQKVSKLPPFPGIAHWFADILEPVYERLHDGEMRKRTKEQVEKLKIQGDLVKIALLFDRKDIFKKDYTSFREGMREYSRLREELKMLEYKLQKPERFGIDMAKEVASVVSGALAAIIIIGFIIVYFVQGVVL